MKISTRGRYAVRLMQDIAAQGNDRAVSLRQIAEDQQISVKYLEQIAAVLSKAGALDTVPGRSGGYRIHGDPAAWSIYQVLTIVEGSTAPVSCLESEENTCPRRDVCASLPVWEGLDRVVREYLSGISIADLCK